MTIIELFYFISIYIAVLFLTFVLLFPVILFVWFVFYAMGGFIYSLIKK